MCGINGIIDFTNTISSKKIEEMNEALTHRGTDANGTFLESNVALGHTRLSIIDLSTAANQPFTDPTGRYTLVYNGEVYNFEEIKKDLQLNCVTNSDTEVVLLSFIKLGHEAFKLFNGMFAMAIYDKEEDQVILARDRIGIKPLFFYWNKKDQFVFSSEFQVLNKTLDKKALSIDQASIYSFLHLGYIPAPKTIYSQVLKFPSGSYAKIDKKGVEFHSFWSIHEQVNDHVIKSEEDGLTKLDQLLNESIQKRLKSDVPFGCFLSGGIDSSLMAAIAQKNSKEKIKTYSIGFKEASHNESEYAAAVAKKIGTEHHEFTVTEKDAMELIPTMLDAYGEPYADSSALPSMLVAKLARQDVKMTISGDGGDELFMGYGFYNWAKRLNNPISKVLKKGISAGLKLGNERQKRAATLFQYPSWGKKSHIFSQEQYYFHAKELNRLLIEPRDSSVKMMNNAPIFKNVGKRKLSVQELQSVFDMEYYLKDELLTKVDIATMKNSLETRVPLLDHTIIEFALNLDESLKIKNGEQKYLLKEVLYQYLPKELFARKKRGFSIPLQTWLLGDLSYLIDEHLNEENINKYGVVRWKEVKKLIKAFRKGTGFLYTRVWALIVLHYWLAKNEE